MTRFVLKKAQLNTQDGSPDFRNEVAFLRQPGFLEEQMARIDKADRRPFLQRIYVMGCGRSGTWLLTAVLSSLDGVDFYPEEVPLQYFGLVSTDHPTLVLKRDALAHEHVEKTPPNIHIVFILRHPFDVLTSHNPATGYNGYHIPPSRWLGETLALQYLVDTRRPNTTVVRYEDLVEDPHGVQRRLSDELKIPIAKSPSQAVEGFSVSERTIQSMHGLRPIDRKSIERFRIDPAHLAHLRKIRPRLGRLLDWVAETYNYNVSLDE